MSCSTDVVILAAGLGTRLARPTPKALTMLRSGETILGRQLRMIHAVFGVQARATIVVGFKLDLVMEAAPAELFAYNERYDRTNTAKSLLRAIEHCESDRPCLWLNGDVVFEEDVLARVRETVAADRSAVAVVRTETEDEEVTYATGPDGFLTRIGKGVAGEGEAVGINVVSSGHRRAFLEQLAACDDDDYFERAIERTVEFGLAAWTTVDVTGLHVVEIDSEEDLAVANTWLGPARRAGDRRALFTARPGAQTGR